MPVTKTYYASFYLRLQELANYEDRYHRAMIKKLGISGSADETLINNWVTASRAVLDTLPAYAPVA